MMTLEQLKKRHSVRSFSAEPLKDEDVAAINAEISYINSHIRGMHFQLFTNDDEPFRGFTRSYGFFKGVRNYIACVADSSYEMWEVRAGFAGEQLVMMMVERGIGTCFVSGTFSSAHVNAQMRAGWKLPYVIPIGYPAETEQSAIEKLSKKILLGKDRSLTDFYDREALIPYEKASEFFPELTLALEAVACAPSARNSLPVRISIVPAMPDDDNPFAAYGMAESDSGAYTLQARVESTKNLVDLGIAMYNISAVVGGDWNFGNPSTLEK